MKVLNNIWKYLQQQLKPEEEKHLQDWKNISIENQELFDDLDKIWSESEHLDDIKIFDAELNFAEINSQIVESKATVVRPLRWVGIAASLLIVGAIVWWNLHEEVVEEPLYKMYTAVNADTTLTLPDNSLAQLRQGASLRYFTRMDEDFDERRVFLNGNATFDVASNDTLPFIVQASKTGIKVLGTVFNIENKDSNDVSVENVEGLIKFYELGNEGNSVILKEGEKFKYNGEAFIDKNVKIPVPKPSKLIIERKYTIQQLWYSLISNFDDKFIIRSYGAVNPEAVIRLNLDQSPNEIIKDLEANPDIEMQYNKSCPDCFVIERIYLNK